MKVTMSDTNITSLIKRCREKESQGYDYITKIHKQSSHRANYVPTERGYKRKNDDMTTKFVVSMRRVEHG